MNTEGSKTVPQSISHVGLRMNTKHGDRASLPLLREPGVFSAQPPTILNRELIYQIRFDAEGNLYLPSDHDSLYYPDMVMVKERAEGEIDLNQVRQKDAAQVSGHESLWYSKVEGIEAALRWVCHKLEDETMGGHPNNPYFSLLEEERESARRATGRVIHALSLWERWPDLSIQQQQAAFSRYLTSAESQQYLQSCLDQALGKQDLKPDDVQIQPARVKPYLSALNGLQTYYDEKIQPSLESGDLEKAKERVVRSRVRLEEIMLIYADWRTADPNPKRMAFLQRRMKAAIRRHQSSAAA